MFENALMLAGLGGAVVPLVIHLLSRARYRSMEWGAMMFLDPPGAPSSSEPGRLREWTLLGVRMSAVALLAVALARPVFGTAGGAGAAGAGAGEVRVAAAIVMDCSASMDAQDVAGPRIEQARAAVLQILSTMKRGDRVALFPAAPAAQPGQLTGDLQAVAARAAELRPVAGRTDIAATIESAAELLGRQERVSRQIFVITDRQASNWHGVSEEFADRWRAHAPLGRFVVVPVGGRETANLLVESVSLVNPPAVERCPGEVQVRVRSLSAEARTGVPLVVRLGEREVFTTTLNVPAGETVTATAVFTFQGAGAQRLSAEIRGQTGGPSLDDRREIVIDVSPPLRTLLVRSRRDGATAAAAGDVVRAALAPFAAAADSDRRGQAVAAVDEVLVDALGGRDLSGYRVIMLDDVAALDQRQVDVLEQFVYAGGGLIIAPGPTSQASDYNRLMYREEGALLPALLQSPVAPPQPVGIDRASLEPGHPMLHFLTAHGDAPLSGAVSRFFATTARTPDARVLASFSSGEPFLLEAPFGRGRVVLVTSSLRMDWSTLPLTPLYLPLVQATLRYTAGTDVRERNFGSGAEVVARFEPAVSDTRATVVRPDRSRDACEIISADGRSEARYAATDLAGVYTVRAGGGRGARGERVVMFSVAPPPDESDLTPLGEAGWTRLEGQLSFIRMEPSAGERSLASRLIGSRATGGLPGADRWWLAALAGVLGLFILEMALARFWSGTRGAAAATAS